MHLNYIVASLRTSLHQDKTSSDIVEIVLIVNITKLILKIMPEKL